MHCHQNWNTNGFNVVNAVKIVKYGTLIANERRYASKQINEEKKTF